MVESPLVIIEYRITKSNPKVICVSQGRYPNMKNVPKQSMNAETKKTREPSSVLMVPVYFKLMLCFPYFFPKIEASVSEIIMIRIPAIGKYICFGAIITNKITKSVIDKQ